MGHEALAFAFGLITLAGSPILLFLVRRETRAMREAIMRETDRIEREVQNANGENRVLVAHAVASATRAAQAANRAEAASSKADEARTLVGCALSSVVRAAQAAKRAEDASDRSTIASEAAAQCADEARGRAREARMWARMVGVARARPVELRRTEPEPRPEPAAEQEG